MKKYLFLFVTLAAVTAHGQQSLKDALYGGKLRLDTGTVLRKGDDLSSRIDTSTRKPEPPRPIIVSNDSITTVITQDAAGNEVTKVTVKADSAAAATATTASENGSAVKDNNKIWKGFIDSLTDGLRTEVMTSKKIKAGSYSVLVEYEIGLEGEITVNNVTSAPENTFLNQQVRDRIDMNAPKLNPLLSQYGKPRKAVKRQTIVLTK